MTHATTWMNLGNYAKLKKKQPYIVKFYLYEMSRQIHGDRKQISVARD
jgi:hypothetical protein